MSSPNPSNKTLWKCHSVTATKNGKEVLTTRLRLRMASCMIDLRLIRHPGKWLNKSDRFKLSNTQRLGCRSTRDFINNKRDKHQPDSAVRKGRPKIWNQPGPRCPKDLTTVKDYTSEASYSGKREKLLCGRQDPSNYVKRSTKLLSTLWLTQATFRGLNELKTFWSTTGNARQKKLNWCRDRNISPKSMNLISVPRSLKTQKKSWGGEMQKFLTSRVSAPPHLSTAGTPVTTPSEIASPSSTVFMKTPSAAMSVNSISTVLALTQNAPLSRTLSANVWATVMAEQIEVLREGIFLNVSARDWAPVASDRSFS